MKGEKGFDDAQGDMKEAEGDLSGGRASPARGARQTGKGAAVDAQGRALEAMREGAQGLQKQMQSQGQGKGGTARAAMSRAGRARANCPAMTPSAAERRAIRAATTGRSTGVWPQPNARAASWRSCAAASPIPPARSTNATISSG